MKELLAYRIKRYIRENLGLSDISPEQIAGHFGVSRRQLYNLLKPVGGVARYQLHLRLQRCQRDIRSLEHAHLSLSEIAYRWGFKHPATFSRNFRSAFGITPGEARAQAYEDSVPLENSVASNNGKRQRAHEHHQWFHAIGI